MSLDDISPALCDVKGCPQPRSGEILEVPIGRYRPMFVRVAPCASHERRLLDFGAGYLSLETP